MSPFRIIGCDKDGNKFILSAMLSTNKESGAKSVYIIQKVYVPELADQFGMSAYEFEKEISYSMSTRRNSSIISTYRVSRADHRAYSLSRVKPVTNVMSKVGIELTDTITNRSKTLFDCQKTAMEDYCSRNGLDIIQIM